MADQLEQDLRALADKAVAASRESTGAPVHPRSPRLRRPRLVLGVAAATAVAVVLIGIVVLVDRRDQTTHTQVDTTAPAQTDAPPLPAVVLDVVARQVASTGTASGPVRYVHSVRSTAGPLLSGGDVTGGPLADVAVWAVVVPGTFVDTKAYIPPGASDPTGTYLDLAVTDSAQPMVLDFGLGDRTPDLTALGPVGTVALPTGTATGHAQPCVGAQLRLPSTAEKVQVDLQVQAIDGREVIRHETVPDGEAYDFTLPAGQYRIGAVPGYPVPVNVLPGRTTAVPDESCK